MAERIKSVLIALLILSLAFFLVFSYALTTANYPLSPADLLYEVFGRTHGQTAAGGDYSFEAAAIPCQIAVSRDGGIYMPLSPSQFDELYPFASQYVEEAVGSAGSPYTKTRDDYKNALQGEGILFVYDYPLPFYMLYDRADESFLSLDVLVSSLFICPEGDKVSLMVRTSDETFLGFDTESSAEALRSACSLWRTNGLFAFDLEGSACDEFSPLITGADSLPSYTLLPPVFSGGVEVSRDILNDFSINSYLTTVYRDLDSLVYVEGGNRLHLYDDGRMIFSGALPISVSPLGDERAEMLDMLSVVRTLAFSLWQKTSSGGAVLCLSSVQKEDGSYIFVFETYIGGCFIERSRSACSVKAEDGVITNMSVYPIRLSPFGSASFLPYPQAAAAAPAGSRLLIQYQADETGVFVPGMRAERK